MCLKYTKNTTKHRTDMSPRGKAHLPEESRPSQLENKPKTKSNQLNSAPNHHGQDKKPTGGNPPKMGTSGPSQGAAAPPVSPNSPILNGLPLTDVPKAVHRVWSRWNIHICWFGALMRGSSIFQGINPSSPPIKGGPPPHFNNTPRRRATPLQK
jgi:hypothetical protein